MDRWVIFRIVIDILVDHFVFIERDNARIGPQITLDEYWRGNFFEIVLFDCLENGTTQMHSGSHIVNRQALLNSGCLESVTGTYTGGSGFFLLIYVCLNHFIEFLTRTDIR